MRDYFPFTTESSPKRSNFENRRAEKNAYKTLLL